MVPEDPATRVQEGLAIRAQAGPAENAPRFASVAGERTRTEQERSDLNRYPIFGLVARSARLVPSMLL